MSPSKPLRWFSVGAAVSAAFVSTAAIAGGVLTPGGGALYEITPQLYPVVIDSGSLSQVPFRSMGYAETRYTDFVEYRGSAVIAKHPQLLYTAAHLTYDDGVWTSYLGFRRAWHSATAPAGSTLVAARGYYHYSTYGGTNSPGDFAKDFAVAYRTNKSKFGSALAVSANGVADLADPGVPKSIHGYPSYRIHDLSSGFYYQNQTGPFLGSFYKESGNYRLIDDVTTGPGNSGGGVVVRTNGKYFLSGILVSGSSIVTGVYGLGSTADKMAGNALVSAGIKQSGVLNAKKTKSFYNRDTLILRDGSTKYDKRVIKVSSMPKKIVSVKFSLDIASDYNDDMDIYLKSPKGRIRWIQKKAFAAGNGYSISKDFDHFIIKDQNYSSTYAGQNPNGKWTIFMRDGYRAYYCAFRKAVLTIGSR